MERLKLKFIPILLFVILFPLSGQDFHTNDLKKHVYYLASDKLKGRAPGTRGEKLAYKYIRKEFKRAGLTPMGTSGFLQYFEYDKMRSPHDTLSTGKKNSGVNVIGYIDNNAQNTIVIGAHYDHLGTGQVGFSPDKTSKGKIHNGADDNASGTAGVIELAKFFSKNGYRENNNFLFICFSAEEEGLIGSKHFTDNPTIDLSKVHFMYNMDMIGRLNDSTKKLMIHGVGTSPGFADLFPVSDTNLIIVTDSSGIGGSDHTSFYMKKIPVLHFFTGQHKDYHRPTDDADKINYEGMQQVLKFIAVSAEKLDEEPKLAFTPTRSRSQRTTFKVSLGVMPDYSFTGKGMRIDAVSEGKPAQISGITEGDIIQAINNEPVDDIYAYMNLLSKFNKGDKATVTILRKKEIVRVTVQF
jgi:Zn-dependent M28 family amino/carboxypeptidase